MLQILSTIAPIFIVIIVGHLLWRARLFGDENWTAIGNICYFLLFPCLLVKTLSSADLLSIPIAGLSFAMVVTLLVSSALLISFKGVLTKRLNINDAAFTSLFQGITRWHGFIALAIATALYGDYGVTLIALAIAVMVPIINIINVAVLIVWGDNDSNIKIGPQRVISEIIQNPFIIACFIGVIINISSIELPKSIYDAITIMSSGALGLSLLAIGAGLRISQIKETKFAILLAVLLRLLGMPIIMFVLTSLVGINGVDQTVAIIAAAVPTAASSYILAQKLGGDQSLMANIITLQVIIAAITLPLAIVLAEKF